MELVSDHVSGAGTSISINFTCLTCL